jgi:hypothetical protein
MMILFAGGSYYYSDAISDQEEQAKEIEAIRYNAGLLQLTVEHIGKKQDKMDVTLTQVRDLVLKIEAKLE